MFRLPPAVQAEPSYSSVAFVDGGIRPPIAKAAFCSPAPAKLLLAVPKFPPGDQLNPLYSSVLLTPTVVKPPKPRPAV